MMNRPRAKATGKPNLAVDVNMLSAQVAYRFPSPACVRDGASACTTRTSVVDPSYCSPISHRRLSKRRARLG